MEAPDSGKIINLVTLIGMLLLVFIIYKVLDAVGIIKTRADKKEDAAKAAAVTDLRINTFFSPDTYTGQSQVAITDETAKKYAKQLRSAMSGVGTDEETIYTIFGQLPSKLAISSIAYWYKDQYGFPFYILSENLQDDLLNELSPAEVATLMQIINKLK